MIPEKYQGFGEAVLESPSKLGTSSGDSPLDSDTKEREDGYIVVTFDGGNDPSNPLNWSLTYKTLFIIQTQNLIAFVYMVSAIYTPGIPAIMADMNISQTLARPPLTLFVFGYDLGPMIFSPLSENARFGRTNIYIVTLFIFFILQIPTALLKDIA